MLMMLYTGLVNQDTNVLERLRKYMYTVPDAIEKKEEMPIFENTFTCPDIIINEPENLYEDADSMNWVSPDQLDSLFWCMYIAHFGYADYVQIGRNYGARELEIKQAAAKDIQGDPSKLKRANIKMTKVAIQEILSELVAIQKTTSIMVTYALASFFKMNIILANETKKTFLEIKLAEEFPTILIYKEGASNLQRYKLNLTPMTNMELSEFSSNWFRLENNIKPLKPITFYKTDQLFEMALKLGITNIYKKKELHTSISTMVQWT
jgi:hypothetical protein